MGRCERLCLAKPTTGFIDFTGWIISNMGRYNAFLKPGAWLFLFLFLGLPHAVAWQAEPDLPAVIHPLNPAEKHRNLDKAIARLLIRYHYKQGKLDDTLSHAILDSYLESLDVNRSYFLASDIAAFNKYRATLDDSLQSGNLAPAYEIFHIYQQRLAERTDRILAQLHREIDFSINESMETDRSKFPWAKNQAELDEIWRKRLKHELLTLMLAGKELTAAKETLRNRYLGLLRRTARTSSDDVFQLYMNAVSRSFDPHTAYFSPRTSENFNIQMRLSLEGIGSVLRMEDEWVTVVELVPGGPADLSKQIKPEDKIIAVGQGNDEPMVDIVGWRLDDVVDIIRGPRGSVVRLQVVPAAAPSGAPGVIVRLVRDTVKLEKQAAHSEVKTLSLNGRNIRIGILTIPTFYSDFAAAQKGDQNYRSTTRDVRRLLHELQTMSVDGIVVDLRQNGGGSLQEAVELTGLFIKDGPIVQVRNTNGNVELETDPDPTQAYAGPLAVLVDRFSASASEIFAGAIQDYGRGVVIGEPTFGKGTVQTLINLNRFVPEVSDPAGQLKLTVAKFYRISGGSTQHRGVVPDLAFPSTFSSDEVGESSEKYALPWDKIQPAHYQSSPYPASLISELAQLHQARLTTDAVLKQVLEDIEDTNKIRQQKTISLLQKQRVAERDKLESRRLARENQIRSLLGLPSLQKNEKKSERDQKDEPDPWLDESVRITADLTNLLNKQSRVNKFVMSVD